MSLVLEARAKLTAETVKSKQYQYENEKLRTQLEVDSALIVALRSAFARMAMQKRFVVTVPAEPPKWHKEDPLRVFDPAYSEKQVTLGDTNNVAVGFLFRDAFNPTTREFSHDFSNVVFTQQRARVFATSMFDGLYFSTSGRVPFRCDRDVQVSVAGGWTFTSGKFEFEPEGGYASQVGGFVGGTVKFRPFRVAAPWGGGK